MGSWRVARSHIRYTVADRAGNAIQNATVTFFVTGTSTLVTDLYTTASAGSPVASASVLTNNQGEAEAWMDTPKTVDVQVSDTGQTAFAAGLVGSLSSFDPFTETVEILPPPEEVATQSGANTFSGTITFLTDPTFAGPSGAPVHLSGTESVTGDKTFSGTNSFITNALSFFFAKSQTKPYDFTHPQYGGSIAGDWTVAFNAAALACSTAGGGEFLIPEASTPYDLSLSDATNARCGKLYSNVEYIGRGPESILRLKQNAAGNASGTRVLGTASGGVSNIVLANFTIDKDTQTSPTDQDHGIYISQGDNLTVERLIVKNTGAATGADGINLSLCSRSEIANCNVSGFSRVLINTQYTTTSVVRDCKLHDSTGWAMKMEFDSVATSYGMRFIDNSCEAIGSGISLTKGAGTLSDAQVVGNYFEMSAGTGNAINIEADNVTVERNNVRNGTGAMIRSQRGATKLDIINNTLTGGSASGTHGAIEIGGGSGAFAPPTGVKILGNTLDTVPQYGVYLTQVAASPFVPSSVQIMGNKFLNTVGAAVRIAGSTGVELHDNRYTNCGTGGDNCAILLGSGNKGSARITIHDNRFNDMTKGVDITAASAGVSTVDASAGVIGSAVSTSLVVASGDGASFYVGQYIKISTEIMKVTAISTDTLTVTRGTEGTTAINTIAAGNAVSVLYALDVEIKDNTFSNVTTPINGISNLTGSSSVGALNQGPNGSGTPATTGTSTFQNVTANGNGTITGTLGVTGTSTLGTVSAGAVTATSVSAPGVGERPTFSYAGVVAAGTGSARYYFERSMTVTSVRASVGTAPTGATLIVDVNKNGTTIYTTQANRPTIAISGFTATANSPDVTTFTSGDYLTVDIDQVGSTVAGSDLTVEIEMRG